MNVFEFKAKTLRDACEVASGIPPRSVHRIEIEPTAGGWAVRLATTADEDTIRTVARCVGPLGVLAASLRRVSRVELTRPRNSWGILCDVFSSLEG